MKSPFLLQNSVCLAAVSNFVIHCLTNTTVINKPYKIRIFDFHCLIDETAINRSSSTSRLLVWLLPMNIEANLNHSVFFFNLEGSEFPGSEFSWSEFPGSEFSWSEFSGFEFSGSEFSGSEV